MSFNCDICGKDASVLKFKEIEGGVMRYCEECSRWKGRVPFEDGELKKGLIR